MSRLQPSQARRRKSELARILNILGLRMLDIKILFLLYEKCGNGCSCLTAREIASALSKSRSSIRSRLKHLISMGLVRKKRVIHSATQRFVLCYEPALSPSELVSWMRQKLFDMFRNLENQIQVLLKCGDANAN